jgi:AcrR family transcriptional regulator
MTTTAATEPRALRADARRNRDAIVQAARAIVAERGEEAQIQDVASRAGVGVGTVYRHFPNKDALMAELVSQCARDNAALATSLGDEEPWTAFSTLVRSACDRMAADAARRRVWSLASADAVALAQDAKDEMQAACTRLIERAHAAGVLREDFLPADMPGLMCGLAAAIEAEPPGGWERLVGFALDGLRAR